MTLAAVPFQPTAALSVTELTRLIKARLESEPRLGDVWVAGEISNLSRAASGHVYFTLADEAATLRCAMFRREAERLRFEPADGMQAAARGRIGVFERSGQYQLYVSALEPVGAGALALATEQLKKRLAAEGLFDTATKRSLPALPRRVALVTSPQGAAVRDMIRIAHRRFPGIDLVVVPVLVQGPEAPQSIACGLELVPTTGADVAILGRGGGSLEELAAFNTETVARAIRACPIPVVSAVGHETDVTIADFAADLRAPTPSAAAELVVPERTALERELRSLAGRAAAGAISELARARRALADVSERRAFADPLSLLAAPRQEADELTARIARAAGGAAPARRAELDTLTHRLAAAGRTSAARGRGELATLSTRLAMAARAACERHRAQIRDAAGRLDALSPLAVLARGYSICRTAGGVAVRRPADAPVGSALDILVAQGRVLATVTGHDPAEDPR